MQIVDVTVPGKVLKLAPVGDFQFGAGGCDVAKLKKHIQYGIKNGWSFLGMGDYLDHFSPSNRKALVAAKGSLYDSASELIDTAVESRALELVKGPLKGSQGHWLGAVHGDHSWTFANGEPADHFIARNLGATYLGSAAILRISLKGCPKARPLEVLVTHGSGSSSSSTGKTLHLERLLTVFKVDVVLMGHSHLKYAYTLDQLTAVTLPDGTAKLVNETKTLGITGSFLNGYQQNSKDANGYPSGAYPEVGALKPIPTGGILIEAKPKKEEWGYRWDMFVSS